MSVLTEEAWQGSIRERHLLGAPVETAGGVLGVPIEGGVARSSPGDAPTE